MGRNEDAVGDVRRKIGEVMNKEAGKIMFGWTPEQVTYKEGDVWLDPYGKQWTIKNGLKQSIGKLDAAKTPYFCPACGTIMPYEHHTQFWRRFSRCIECLAKEETKLKGEGKWEEFLKERHKQNRIAWFTDKIQELQDYHDNLSAPEFIHADEEKILMIEKWDIDLTTVRKDLAEEITKLKDDLAKIQSGELDESTG
jgi:hypothetical protein